MELFEVTLEKEGDYHDKRARTLYNVGILLLPFPVQQPYLQPLSEHRIYVLLPWEQKITVLKGL